MKLEVNVYVHQSASPDIVAALANLLALSERILKGSIKIMATQAELAQALRDLKDQNDKARVEVLQKIADLEAALENAGSVTPEVQEAFDALKASVQTDDDIVTDVPPTP